MNELEARNPRLRLLLVEDNPDDVRLIREMLSAATDVSFVLEHADRLSTGLEHLAEGNIDLILLELLLPDSEGLDTFLRLQEQAAKLPVVVLTVLDNEKLALETVHRGAQDYLVKGRVNSDLLTHSIRYSIERKRTEEKLRELAEMEKRIITLVAHELRTPLTSIQGSASLLRDEEIAPATPEQREVLDVIIRNSQRLSSLVNTYFDLEKIEAKVTHLSQRYFLLEELLAEVADRFRPAVLKKKLELRTDLESSLLVCGDRGQLAQVFANLFSNAIKFSEAGTVALKARRLKSQVAVELTDQGRGIPEGELPHIFEKFYRAHSLTEKDSEEGTGLGLAIAKAIVEEHGGRIQVSSNLCKGSTFTVILPLAPERREPPGNGG
jgi:signal transduction histidine kinase